jgi:hypothetical protein
LKLFAISDLHLGAEANRNALVSMDDHGDDWLIGAVISGKPKRIFNSPSMSCSRVSAS